MYGEFVGSKVGDRITVYSGRSSPYEFRTIRRVLKTKVIDDKGSEWTMRGNRYGDGDRGLTHGASARKYRPQDRQSNLENAKERRDRNKREQLRTADWRVIPMAKINRILAILHEKEGSKTNE